MLFTVDEMKRIDEEMPHLDFTPGGIEIRSPEEVGEEEAKRIIEFERDTLRLFGRNVKNIDQIGGGR